MQAKTIRYAAAATVAVLAVATAAVVAWPSADNRPMIGVPTGEYVGNAPVYRLPTVTVAVKRSEELAKIAREEAMASAHPRQ
jgi:hypothetical protein